MDLSDLIDRNAAFTPDKAAIRFAGSALSYARAGRSASAETARALQVAVGRRARRPRRHPRHQSSRLSRAAVCLRAARRHAGAAQLAARRARAGLHPARRRGEACWSVEQSVRGHRGAAAQGAARRAHRRLGFRARAGPCPRGSCWPPAAATDGIRTSTRSCSTADRLHLGHDRATRKAQCCARRHCFGTRS